MTTTIISAICTVVGFVVGVLITWNKAVKFGKYAELVRIIGILNDTNNVSYVGDSEYIILKSLDKM